MTRLGCRALLAGLVLLGVTPSHAAEPDLVLTGRVVAPGGAPLAEADVQLLAPASPIDAARTALAGKPLAPAVRVRTEASGRFRLAVPRPGLWTVRVERREHVPVEAAALAVLEPFDLGDAELAADQGLVVSATVAGQPVGGVLVQVLPASSGPRRPALWEPAPQFALTGIDGTARLARGREVLRVAATAAGLVPVVRPGVAGARLALAMVAAPATTLAVTTPDGTPAAGTLVALDAPRHPLGFTGADGRLRVSLAAETRLALDAPDGAFAAASITPASAATPDRPAEIARVRLQPPTTVGVQVLDAETRRPVTGALLRPRGDDRLAVTTGADGRAVVRQHAAGPVSVVASARGYQDQALERRVPGSVVTFALAPAAAIEGVVTAGRDAPVAGAEVVLTPVPPERGGMRVVRMFARGSARPSRAITGSDGRFRIAGLDPVPEWSLAARAPGYAPAHVDLGGLAPRKTKTGVTVALASGAGATGTVVDGDGRPVAGADVVLRDAPEGGPGMRILLASPQDGPAPHAVSDREGRVTLEHLAPGHYDVEATKPGFARTTVPRVEIARDRQVDLGRIQLEPGESFDGLVVDGEGRPVEGVEVSAVANTNIPRLMAAAFRGQFKPDAVTGADGRFTIFDRRRGERVNLLATRTGYGPGRLAGVEVPPAEMPRLVLQAACTVSGRVTDRDGTAIPGATLTLRRESRADGGDRFAIGMTVENATADSDGRFTFEGVVPGPVALRASAPGWQDTERPGIDVEPGHDLTGIVIALDAGASLDGRVLLADGTPAAGARVAPVGGDTDGMFPGLRGEGAATTDGDGRYHLDGLKPGAVGIEATRDDVPRAVKDIELRRGANVLDLQLGGGQEVTGRVVDGAGAPVARADVSLGGGRRGFDGPSTETADDGSFRFGSVLDGTYQVHVARRGYADPGPVPVTVAGAPVHDVVVRLVAGGAIAGTVHNVAAAEMSSVQVRLVGPNVGGMESAEPDAQGAFRIENVPAGTFTVTAQVAGSGKQARTTVTLADGQTEARCDLEFGRGFTLTGHVVLGDTPLANVMVAANAGRGSGGFQQTDSGGAFRLEGLDAGTYRVIVNDFDHGLTHTESVTLDADREVTIRLPQMKIAGRVLDSTDQSPIVGAQVRVAGMGGADGGPLAFLQRPTVTDGDGRFVVQSVPAGDWHVTATKSGYAAKDTNVTVAENADVDALDLALDPSEGVTLFVRLPGGSAPDRVASAIVDAGGTVSAAGFQSTGENGRVRLSTIPQGSWDLLVSADGAATATVRVTSPGGPFTVTLPAACTLDVQVPALAGDATPATVAVFGSDGRRYRSLTGWRGSIDAWPVANGRAHLVDVPAGAVTLRVTAADGRTWEAQAVAQPRTAVTVTVK